jgi:hypothetical protein
MNRTSEVGSSWHHSLVTRQCEENEECFTWALGKEMKHDIRVGQLPYETEQVHI